MADPNITDLKYGHFGQPTYSIEDGTWLFGRRPGHDGQLRQLGSWKTAVSSPVQNDDNIEVQATPPVIKMETQSLARKDPNLVPSLDLLPEEARTSAAVISTVHTYDPAIGTLLSFGSVAFEGLYKNPHRVAAVATGENGSVLRLAVLSKTRTGWPQDSVFLEGLSFSDSTSGYWNHEATPLQQVCFAQSDARSCFLAVRTLTRTHIFRPRLHGQALPAQQSQFYNLPPSMMNPNLVLSLSSEQTGGAPHADVTFNPEYQRQFGIIDQEGNWSIWDIERGRNINRGYEDFAICTAIGQVRDEKESSRSHRRDDGWGRISWVGDVNTILVCNRRVVEVFNVRGGQPTPLKSSKLLSERSPDWILDMKVVPLNKHRLCVLTSNRLFLLAVTCQDDVVPTSDYERGLRVLLSWTHFRGADDITLQLSVVSTTRNDTTVFLHSRINRLVTIFRFSDHESAPDNPYSSSDPVSVHLNDNVFGTFRRPTHINSIDMERLIYKEAPKRNDGPGLTYMTSNMQFYRVSVLLSDLSVQQAVFYSFDPDEQNEPRGPIIVEPLSWDTTVSTRITGKKSAVLVEEDNNFIVPDGEDDITLSWVGAPFKLLHRRIGDRSDKMSGFLQRDRYPNTMRGLYEALVSANGASSNRDEELTESVNFADVVDRIGNLLDQDISSEDVFSGTMLELVADAIRVSDVDDASHRLQALITPDNQIGALQLHLIASPTALGLSHDNDESLDMALVYDAVLESWIAPLQANIPSRLRQQKERLARRVAAEVMLSSSRIRRPVEACVSFVPEVEKPGFNQNSAVALPVLPSLPAPSQAEYMAPTSSQIYSSPAHGEPSEAVIDVHPNPVARLSQHLRITKPPPVVPPNISNILTHWKLGADPHAYDWVATNRALNEEVTSDEEASQQDKERLKRKAERLLKRQKRELERERKQAESQPLFGREPGGLRSSPAPAPAMGFGLSSQAQSQSQSQGLGTFGAVQSQVEPGKHGGRPAKKKAKGKGRISGF